MDNAAIVELVAQDDGAAAFGLLGMLCCLGVFFLICFIPALLTIAGIWKVLAKAGKPGWAAIVPIYNYMVLAEAAGKEAVYGLLLLIPIAQFYFAFVIYQDLARRFGKDTGFAIGMLLLPFVFFPILGFGSAQYRRGSGPGSPPSPPGAGSWQPPSKSW